MNTFANNLPKKRGTVPNIEDSKQGHLRAEALLKMSIIYELFKTEISAAMQYS